MYEIVNKSLSAEDKFMPKIHLLIVLVDHSLKTKKEFKNSKQQEMQNIFTKMN